MAKVLVTGGAGFIGSHLCDALLEDSHEVVALDNFDDFYDAAVKRHNLTQARANRRFTLVEGDVRDEEVVTRVLAGGVGTVVHLAARAGVRPSIEQPLLYQDVNVRGTLVLLEACRRLDGCQFIFGSSSSVYGNRQEVPFSEGDRVDDPISPYAATKKAGELMCHTYHHLYGMPITSLRFFTVYGPRQRPDLAIHKFARLIDSGEPVPVYGDGQMMRDFTYVDDIVDGTMRAMTACDSFRVYNLGCSEPVSVAVLIEMLEDALGKRAVTEYRPPQPGDVERTCADITRASRELGYRPTTRLPEGLARFVEWLRRGE